MLLLGKISEKTNLVHFIGKNKVYYDGDLLVHFMYPTSFFTSKINVFAMNKEIPQTSSPLLQYTLVLNLRLLKHFVYNELPLRVEEYSWERGQIVFLFHLFVFLSFCLFLSV